MRIALIGPGCSGKTTLAKELYEHLKSFGYKLDVDAERKLAEEIGFKFRNHTKEEANKYQEILFKIQYKKHILNEKIITDNPLNGMIGYVDGLLKEKIKKVSKNLYDIIFVCEPLEIEDDGVRDLDEKLRKKVFSEAIEYLKSIRKGFCFINGGKEERLKKALDFIKKHLK